ncbi:MAG: beta-lactamase family protein, partial [Clostridia bacterium]|nr:beta-lactamase family protein [Clostridia bacterium]
ALQLYEQGHFLLNTQVREFLPEYGEVTVRHRLPDGSEEIRPATRPVLMRDLFAMSAGLTYDTNSPAFKELNARTNGAPTTREVAAAMAQSPLMFEPGEHWNYSMCHDVLAAVIEVISGQRFSDYLQENIFDPVGMPDTGAVVRFPEDKFARLAKQYAFNEQENKAHEIDRRCTFNLGPNHESGGGGLFSTLKDYTAFAAAMANGGMTKSGKRLLSPATIDLMRTNMLTEAATRDVNWIQLDGYGYGLGVRTMIDKAVGGSNGSLGEFGWSGMAGAYLLVDPDRHLSVTYMQHMVNNLEAYVHPRLRNLTYACLEE